MLWYNGDMAHSFISERMSFAKQGEQRKFLTDTKRILNFNWGQMAAFLHMHTRTLSDWKTEKFQMSFYAAQKLSTASGIVIPSSTVKKDFRAHLIKIAKSGGDSTFKKYGRIGGSENIRKEAWHIWWRKIGQHKKLKILKSRRIHIPSRDVLLAEFVGTMIGDGGVAPYYISITLHADDDKEYAEFVRKMIKKLFHVSPKTYKKSGSNAVDIIVHRKEVVSFCNLIGLKTGNKLRGGLDIPQWIKDEPSYLVACMRGLFDTDGSIFLHSYWVGNKRYRYKKISISSVSIPLLSSVQNALSRLEIKSVHTKNQIRIESVTCVKKFFTLVGSHNPKHLKRYST